METKNFSSTITARISAGAAINKISSVPEWWGVSFTGSAEKQGDKFTIKMGGDSFFDLIVTEMTPDKRIVWLVTDCYMPWFADKREWANTKLIFDLNDNGGETKITFTHEGLTPEVECYTACETGWTHWITRSLLSYLTTGKGDFDQSRK